MAVSLFEQWQNLLGALDRIAGHDSKLVHRQLEVTRSRRHTFILACTADPCRSVRPAGGRVNYFAPVCLMSDGKAA